MQTKILKIIKIISPKKSNIESKNSRNVKTKAN